VRFAGWFALVLAGASLLIVALNTSLQRWIAPVLALASAAVLIGAVGIAFEFRWLLPWWLRRGVEWLATRFTPIRNYLWERQRKRAREEIRKLLASRLTHVPLKASDLDVLTEWVATSVEWPWSTPLTHLETRRLGTADGANGLFFPPLGASAVVSDGTDASFKEIDFAFTTTHAEVATWAIWHRIRPGPLR
jgi:hypothetical protein